MRLLTRWLWRVPAASFLPSMYQAWNDYDPFMPFVETLNEDHQQLLTGSASRPTFSSVFVPFFLRTGKHP